MVAIQNKQAEKLSKDEELKLGRIIKEANVAKNALKNSSGISLLEQNNLHRKINAGEDAVSKLVESNINLVVSIATKYRESYPYAPDLEECVQNGLAGLVVAARKYDSDKNNKFSTMAFPWARQAITRGTNNTARLVRLPENRIENYTQISDIEADLLKIDANLSRTEIDEEIKEITGLKDEDLFVIRNAASPHFSLNKKVGDDNDNETELLDIVSQTSMEDSAEKEAIDNYMMERLYEVLTVLTEVEQHVILSSFEMRFPPLNNDNLLTARAVKKHFGINSSTYKSTLSKALDTLKTELHKKGLSLSDFLL